MSKYVFRETNNMAEFNKFSEENGGSVYQTSYWAKVKANWKPTFFMGFEGETPVLAALCLQRDVKMTKLWYCQDGFVCDTYNEELVCEFASFIKAEMKKRKICVLITDPLVFEIVDKERQDISAVDSLFKAGFVRNPEEKRYEYLIQPTVTVQSHLTGFTPKTFLSKCEKGVRHGLNGAEDGGLIAENYDAESLRLHPEKTDDFYEVLTEVSDRVSFIQREKSYYENIIYALEGKAVLTIIYIDNVKRLEKYNEAKAKKEALEKELLTLENAEKKDKKSIARVKKEIEECTVTINRNERIENELHEKYGDSYPQKIALSTGITTHFGKTAICLYGGTRNLLRNTLRTTHFLNWVRLEESFRQGMDYHDLGRITGDPYDENNPLFGLCKYKKSYNGEITEYVGEMYLIANKFKFKFFKDMFPVLMEIKNKFFKSALKSKTVKNSAE